MSSDTGRGSVDPNATSVARAASEGDDEAFGLIYQQYFPAVFDFLARLLGDRAAAEELTQDSFTAAYEHRGTLRRPEAVRSWLFSIAYHRAVDHLRRAGRERVGLPEAAEIVSEEDPTHRVVTAEAAELVWAAARSLEARQYAVLDLSMRHGLSGAELAKALDISSGHAAVLAHRARAALARAVRALLVARSRDRCERLAALVPVAAPLSLSRAERDRVERHIAGCQNCRALAERLADPAALLGVLVPVAAMPRLERFELVADRLRAGSSSPTGRPGGAVPRWRAGLPKGKALGAVVGVLLVLGAALGVGIAVGGGGPRRAGPLKAPRSRSSPTPSSSALPAGPSPLLHWTVVAAPSPPRPARPTLLHGVTCTARYFCWAVGEFAPAPGGSDYRTLALGWNGTSWRVVPTPNGALGPVLAQSNGLNDVTCVTRSDCFAVGEVVPAGGSATAGPRAIELMAIMHFSGSTWRLVPNLELGGGQGIGLLTGVVCASTRQCFTVGDESTSPTSTAEHAVMLGWNGASWQVVALPPLGVTTGYSHFGRVACFSTTDCWAVGTYVAQSGADLALALHFDGHAWDLVATPDPGIQVPEAGIPPGVTGAAPPNVLSGISCPTPADCWAVGDYLDPTGHKHTLALHFGGHTWHRVAVPDPGGPGGFSDLVGVACPSRDDCWAIGNSSAAGSSAFSAHQQVFALHFDGHAWRLATLPNPGVPGQTGPIPGFSFPGNVVSSLTCPSIRQCFAVGSFATAEGGEEALVLEGATP